MTTEKLTKANNLTRLISDSHPRIEQLKKDIKALEEYEYNDFSMVTKEFPTGYYPRQNHKVQFRIDKNIIIKILKDELYIQENLLKKYTLEFDNL